MNEIIKELASRFNTEFDYNGSRYKGYALLLTPKNFTVDDFQVICKNVVKLNIKDKTIPAKEYLSLIEGIHN